MAQTVDWSTRTTAVILKTPTTKTLSIVSIPPRALLVHLHAHAASGWLLTEHVVLEVRAKDTNISPTTNPPQPKHSISHWLVAVFRPLLDIERESISVRYRSTTTKTSRWDFDLWSVEAFVYYLNNKNGGAGGWAAKHVRYCSKLRYTLNMIYRNSDISICVRCDILEVRYFNISSIW